MTNQRYTFIVIYHIIYVLVTIPGSARGIEKVGVNFGISLRCSWHSEDFKMLWHMKIRLLVLVRDFYKNKTKGLEAPSAVVILWHIIYCNKYYSGFQTFYFVFPCKQTSTQVLKAGVIFFSFFTFFVFYVFLCFYVFYVFTLFCIFWSFAFLLYFAFLY